MSFKSTLLLLYSFYKPVKKLVIINIVWYFDHSNFNIFAIRVVQNYNTVRSEAKTFYDLFFCLSDLLLQSGPVLEHSNSKT